MTKRKANMNTSNKDNVSVKEYPPKKVIDLYDAWFETRSSIDPTNL
jgi:hypothetical protein